MERYNYLEAVTNDAKQAILENLKYWEFSDRDELEEEGKIQYLEQEEEN